MDNIDKFKGKYRTESNRLKGWDYVGKGIYFITIVTQNRECNLGYIENNKMFLPDFGKIVKHEWLKSFEIHNELILDKYIIMPNHLHCIVIIDKNDMDNETNDDGSDGSHDLHDLHVETHSSASLQQRHQQPPEQSPNSFFRKPKSISSFIAGFKSAVNTKIDDYIDKKNLETPKYNRKNHFFLSNYYDHIIRNKDEYYKIKNYIINNPANWGNDELRNLNNE